MSTGKRLAKRSIVGTRVCVPGDDGLFYPSVIQATKTQEEHIWGTQQLFTRYTVKLDHGRLLREYAHVDIVGPGFQGISGLTLQVSQRVYVTHQGREIAGIVKRHRPDVDEVVIDLCLPQQKTAEVTKRLEEVRLLESRKSLRLMDQDLDFAKMAEMGFSAAELRKRNSSSGIDVPQSARKRRPPTPVSTPVHELDVMADSGDVMDECAAALVLMRLSCSPHSPRFEGHATNRPDYGLASPSSSGASSYGSGYSTLSESAPASYFDSWVGDFTPLKSHSDDGIVTDESSDGDDSRSAKRHIIYQCTWPGCRTVTTTCSAIEEHVRAAHIGPRTEGDDLSDHEEEFYYTETEGVAEDEEDKLEEVNELSNPSPAVQIFPVGFAFNNSPPPTSPQMELARLPHEDLEYNGAWKAARPISIPARVRSISWSSGVGSYPPKQMKLSRSGPSPKASPVRRPRGEAKKCRKVYGMEHREMWCTQCKWKKACTRFGD